MAILYFLLVLIALVCFAAAAASGKVAAKWNLVALGLALWVSVEVIQRLKGLG